MTETLEGKHIVVTGGTGALGGAVVGKLLSDGAICHVPNAHAAAPTHFPLTSHDRVQLVHNVDLSDPAKVEAFYSQVPGLWGSIHLAGGFTSAPVEKIESASFAEMMDTNARTAFLCCRAGMVAYAASKAAVAAMTVAMAEELKHKGILVNAVAPSTLDTPANRADMPDADVTRWVSLEAAAEAIAYLASPANQAMSGTLVPLYGRA
ncbi:SDR family NAD(P)-dependent oxidoreductase [Mesorhizobium sp. M7A.F.Ca.CA.002.10.1.1]|uniref:SDR family NAD(P)-dependent oxidoreductase n=1 Tax=Mesorhizobium sp. M7A.F.Ca.CA.002.10.1.1 TaxID=2496685 RepID=UPI000FCA9693|nr:SDR family NAD(P)-dependent oxidoreductase [Mesorhizobium sp. M7A.F.Ca.CA.002.10.1.1]RVB22756.1 SDR family NAD(P)-dependent oxidoreductase [Mesorhizobium sp. M7A.F.Ca.CA.002.10.1.1]